MSALLDVLEEAAELRETAQREFVRAIVNAREGGCTLRPIARAAGISLNGLQYILAKERSTDEHRN